MKRTEHDCPDCLNFGCTLCDPVDMPRAVFFGIVASVLFILVTVSCRLISPTPTPAALPPAVQEAKPVFTDFTFQTPTIENIKPLLTVHCDCCCSSLTDAQPDDLLAMFERYEWKVTGDGFVLCNRCVNTWRPVK